MRTQRNTHSNVLHVLARLLGGKKTWISYSVYPLKQVNFIPGVDYYYINKNCMHLYYITLKPHTGQEFSKKVF